MFALKRVTNRLQRCYYYFAVVGFVLLSLGYLLRGQVNPTGNGLFNLLLGVFPNLLGSFATAFLLLFLLLQRFPSIKTFERFYFFGLINLFTMAGSILIEYFHVVFQLGVWDPNDIVASVVGGLVSMVLFYLTPKVLN